MAFRRLHLERPIVMFFMSEMFHRYSVSIINVYIKGVKKSPYVVSQTVYFLNPKTEKKSSCSSLGADCMNTQLRNDCDTPNKSCL